MRLSDALTKIDIEFKKSMKKYPPFNSPHEGYGVMLEEFDELWDEIKKKKPSEERMMEEAVQIGAMAVKFLVTLIGEENNNANNK